MVNAVIADRQQSVKVICNICFVSHLQPPAPAIRSSATATCASTTRWCATGFRIVSTPGMKTTVKVSGRTSSIMHVLSGLEVGDWPFTKKRFLFSPVLSSQLIFYLFSRPPLLSFPPPPPLPLSFHILSFFSSPTLLPIEKRSKGLFHQITKTHGTVIGVSSGVVLVLLIISILVQMKQPRKKVGIYICLLSKSAQFSL